RMSTFDKDVEILFLRHQLEVLGRKTPRFSWADRAFLALAARPLPRRRWSALLLTPATALEWQRRIVRRRWTYPSRPGAPRASGRDDQAHMPTGPGEPAVGLPANRGRVEETRPGGLGHRRARCAGPPRSRAGASTVRTRLCRVPPYPGKGTEQRVACVLRSSHE